MDQRKRISRAGLLVFLLFVLSAAFPNVRLRAQEGEAGEGITGGTAMIEEELPEVRLETSPANPMVNNPWILAVLVNHPRSSDVTVKPPRFPPTLVLERVRTETRSIQGERWTRVEFLFTPNRTGSITLAPFGVSVLGRQAETAEVTVRFREETRTVRRYEPRFRWASPLPSVLIGEQAELFLELSNWDPSKNPPRGFLWGRAPRNAILEEGFPIETGEGSFRYPVFIVALEATELILESLSLETEGFKLTVPELKLTVPPAETIEAVTLPAPDPLLPAIEEMREEISYNAIQNIPFPGKPNPETVFPIFRNEYKRISARIEELWESNQRVEALAEIRRNERDSFSGPFLTPLRKEMEQALGLGFTGNERWQPLKISVVSWVIVIFLVLSIFLVLLFFRPHQRFQWKKAPGKNVTSGRRSGFRTVIILVISIGVAVILVEEGLGNFLIGRLNTARNSAVLERTAAYKIPDTRGAINVRFGEGQPVTVTDFHLDWCYAETSDGRFGWVPREAVVIY